MAALFGAPKPPPLPPPPPPLPDLDEEERRQRLAAIERRRRGRAGTIATSERGLLGLSDDAPRRKSLLGE
ncbi:MAG: hypothetical protein ACREB6_06765 [Rhodospirillales bacterium]